MAMSHLTPPYLLKVLLIAIILTTSSTAQTPETTSRDIDMFYIGQYTHGRCEVQGIYPHDMTSFDLSRITRQYPLQQPWQERCRNCTCTHSGVLCRGPRCQHHYDFSLEEWCLQWSDDGCCCERLGCRMDGKEYNLGESIPYGRGNPCLNCTCQIGWSRKQCLMQQCYMVEMECDSRTETFNHETCCPTYHCPLGVKCETIPDPFPNTARHELLDWYGGHLEPIQQGMTQHFHLDSWTSYVCTCERGGTASCEMRTYGIP